MSSVVYLDVVDNLCELIRANAQKKKVKRELKTIKSTTNRRVMNFFVHEAFYEGPIRCLVTELCCCNTETRGNNISYN